MLCVLEQALAREAAAERRLGDRRGLLPHRARVCRGDLGGEPQRLVPRVVRRARPAAAREALDPLGVQLAEPERDRAVEFVGGVQRLLVQRDRLVDPAERARVAAGRGQEPRIAGVPGEPCEAHRE